MRFCSVCCAAYRTDITRCPYDQIILLEDGPDPLLETVIAGRYRVLSLLGSGGMGRVYKAEHTEIGKIFALKVLFGDLATKETMLARFRREARAVSLLKHIHIISIVDFGLTKQNLAYLVMELLSGNSLSSLVKREGPFSVGRTFHIGKQIALALAHAHDKGILHRDLKPENVMLEDREEGADFVTVLDFGLARIVESKISEKQEKLTAVGTVQGTPEFMSPEQCQALSLGPPSDLYSLGILLYFMLSQELPFALPEQRAEMLSLHAFEPPRPLSSLIRVAPPVETLIMRLLEKEPEKRFPSGREVALAIDEALAKIEQHRARSLTDTWDDDPEETLLEAEKPISVVSEEQIAAVLSGEVDESSLPSTDIKTQTDPVKEDSLEEIDSPLGDDTVRMAQAPILLQKESTSEEDGSKTIRAMPSWVESEAVSPLEASSVLSTQTLPAWIIWLGVLFGSVCFAGVFYLLFLLYQR